MMWTDVNLDVSLSQWSVEKIPVAMCPRPIISPEKKKKKKKDIYLGPCGEREPEETGQSGM